MNLYIRVIYDQKIGTRIMGTMGGMYRYIMVVREFRMVIKLKRKMNSTNYVVRV